MTAKLAVPPEHRSTMSLPQKGDHDLTRHKRVVKSDGRWLDGEEVQKERRASRVREAALCLDIMKTRSQETVARSQNEARAAMSHVVPTAGARWLKRKSVKIFMVFHVFSRFITKIRPVITRFSRFLGWESFLDANYTNERKLGKRTTETQWHGDEKRSTIRICTNWLRGRTRTGSG